MAKGFTSGGVDFDDLFDPDVKGDGPAASWLTSGGVPLKYAAIGYGTKRPDVGFRSSSGVDVSNLWAAKGSASYNDAVSIPFGSEYSSSVQSGSASSATVALDLRANGQWAVATFSSPSGTYSGAPTSGTWHKAPGAGAGNLYEARFVVNISSQSGPVGSTSVSHPSGWVALSSDRAVNITTTWDPANGGFGEASAGGTVTIEIRKIGEAEIVTSVLRFLTNAFSTG